MISFAIHGGAGALPRSEMTHERSQEFHAALHTALLEGYRLLASGGSALDAVEAAVTWMEDCPLFNAGKGSAFTRDGTVEMEASIMDGKTRKAGATSLLKTVRNPVKLARAVMEKTPHVMLGGEAAEAFARTRGLRFEKPDYFFTPYRHAAMLKLKGTEVTALSEDVVVKPTDEEASSTVGAVALDSQGNLAGSTSSGGTTNKYSGRIAQASIVGSGVYAENATCAVSCTGQGEAFMRLAAAFDVSALMAYRGLDLAEAARTVIFERLPSVQGRGGLIALDSKGHLALPFNTEGMYRGWVDAQGIPHTAIYEAAQAWPSFSR